MSRRMIPIVEDEESISEPLASALEREGYEAAIAPTAEAALDAVRTKGPISCSST